MSEVRGLVAVALAAVCARVRLGRVARHPDAGEKVGLAAGLARYVAAVEELRQRLDLV